MPYHTVSVQRILSHISTTTTDESDLVTDLRSDLELNPTQKQEGNSDLVTDLRSDPGVSQQIQGGRSDPTSCVREAEDGTCYLRSLSDPEFRASPHELLFGSRSVPSPSTKTAVDLKRAGEWWFVNLGLICT